MADEFRKEMQKMGPPWMRGPTGNIFWGEFGGALDTWASRLKECTKARFPDHAPADGLASLGRDRQLDPGPGESEASFRARIRGAWEAWEEGGTPGGILKQMKIAGFPMGTNGAHLIQHNGRWWRLNAGTDALEFGDTMACESRVDLTGAIPTPRLKGFTLDGRDQFYSRFIVLFPVDVPTLRPNTEQAARLNAIVNKWDAGKAVYDGAVVLVTGDLWGWPLTKVWGVGTWGGTTAHVIPPA